MSAWITQQMANNLMKWWRTKFLNGYRQFSDCNEGRVSDTEELLGRLSPESAPVENQETCTTPPPPPPQTTPSPQPTPHQHLNLEEFSCDVSVEGGVDRHGQERQEFSFTLYDFDGHGKITKDDIAGLVTTIYEVLGSSVKVPHYGSKTIRVKLTVSPDQRKHVSATVINNQKDTNKEEKQVPPTKHDVNVTISQQKKKKAKQRRHCCHHEEAEEYSEESDDCSGISGCEEDEEEGEQQQHYKCQTRKPKKQQRPASPEYTTVPNLFIRENNLVNRQPCLKTRKARRRSSSLQRQELLEIIQANMDKNNLSFQKARKQCANHVSLESKQLQSEEKPHKHRHRSAKLQTTPLHCLANFMDPTHFYVDLAALQNTTHLPESNCQYNKLINAVMCVSNNRKAAPNRTQPCRKHLNPSTSNIPVRYQLLEKPLNNIENLMNKTNKKTAKPAEAEPLPLLKRNVKKLPQVVLGHTSSPHHLRHRNRQEDQARAMAQVVRWLEQEFSSGDRKETPPKTESSSSAGEKQSASPESGVERHEHHHVHEHIHHHYHHYQEVPVVV